MSARVVSVARSPVHGFSKFPEDRIDLVEGMGVLGDAHAGALVRHRSRVRVDPAQPNLRQVHLLAAELLDEVAAHGHPVAPGALGENITTRGIDLIALPRGTDLHIGRFAVLTVTGLRNPCSQIDDFSPGLLAHVLRRGKDGGLERRAGIMAVVTVGGPVSCGDDIQIVMPARPHQALERV
ncbi:MOSC domain-containing protein [Roseovarius aquimarinus]|uniref:MOSC domain-containing protein n=1 Tax=Roseovarius aquimarinus TaxID=1229156 RepID=A0ABW7I5Q1_9RHOB